jgi:hypothetical protein
MKLSKSRRRPTNFQQDQLLLDLPGWLDKAMAWTGYVTTSPQEEYTSLCDAKQICPILPIAHFEKSICPLLPIAHSESSICPKDIKKPVGREEASRKGNRKHRMKNKPAPKQDKNFDYNLVGLIGWWRRVEEEGRKEGKHGKQGKQESRIKDTQKFPKSPLNFNGRTPGSKRKIIEEIENSENLENFNSPSKRQRTFVKTLEFWQHRQTDILHPTNLIIKNTYTARQTDATSNGYTEGQSRADYGLEQ